MGKELLPTPRERVLYFTSQVDQSSIANLTKDIVEINQDDRKLEKLYAMHDITYTPKPISILIDSYGGAVYQCFGLICIMNASKTPIHTYVTGCAMSCGFIILIHGHRRFAYNLSTPLYHQVSSGAFGKLKDMEDKVTEAKRLQDILEKVTIERTKITKEKLKDIYEKKTDWYMSATEAKKLGVVDEIVDHIDF